MTGEKSHGKNPMRTKSHVGKNPMRKKSQRKKSHEDKIPEDKIPKDKIPSGKYPKRTKSHKEKNHTRKYSIVFVSLEYILRSQFSNVKNLRIFFITYPFFAHYLFSFSLSDEELALACVLYTYETP